MSDINQKAVTKATRAICAFRCITNSYGKGHVAMCVARAFKAGWVVAVSWNSMDDVVLETSLRRRPGRRRWQRAKSFLNGRRGNHDVGAMHLRLPGERSEVRGDG